MPSLFPVFSGLGSGSVFSEENLGRAEENALTPECAVLLQSCHRTFREQVSDAITRNILSEDSIDLNDFAEPASLIRPLTKYSRNVVMQHAALYLHQILAYMTSQKELGDLIGSAGFCTGLLPAAVAAASQTSVITLISQSHHFFQVALWIGIRSEQYRVDHLTNDTRDANAESMLPCSYVLEGVSEAAAADLLHKSDMGNDVFVSAILSPTRVTLSGIPSKLSTFISKQLPANCRTTAAVVYSLYHHESLREVRDLVIADLNRQDELLRAKVELSAPIFSTKTGKPLALSSVTTLEEVACAILDLIFIEKVDWLNLQQSIVSQTSQDALDRPINIVNYGPGLGMAPSAFPQAQETDVCIRDAAKISKGSSKNPGVSRLAWDDIAIVGMAVELPGASDADTLWQNLVDGYQACSEIPSSRFNVNDYNNGKGSRTLNTKYGNFLENPFLFDAEHFGISRREAKSMDPQQRILLQTAYRALEDAGYVPDTTTSFARDTFGCWIGNATLDYVDNLRSDIDVYYSTGTLRAFLSARISYVFGWSGPSITLDTACSSSIVALHQAARSILAGDCRSALVGAANTITSPDMYLGLDRAHFLSPSGQCKAFDASADGYCRAEGCGVFVIKRLSDALAEGDRIHGVIKAIEINQSGNTHSITHPHVPTQEALFDKMFRESRINPHEISVVEMHGTGTQAGDPNEVESVRRALCKARSPLNPVYLTSLKANIGHAEAVSGIAGLAKLILMTRNGYIPPQVSLKTLNPRIRPLGVDGAAIDANGTEWPRAGPNKARMSMLNNFGAGGSNAAVIIGEHLSQDESELHPACGATTFVCGVSAKNDGALVKLQETVADYLTSAGLSRKPPSLADVSATLTSRRQMYNHRVAVVASSLEELAENLRSATSQNVSKSVCEAPEAVFIFSGQGSQYLGMGRELIEQYEDFAHTVNVCDGWLVKNNYPGCLAVITGEQKETEDGKADAQTWQSFQSAIYVIEVALAKLLESWGIRPQAVAGHSLGEYAALVTAGVIRLMDGLKLVAHRAKLMMEQCKLGQTSMLAVNCSAAVMTSMIDASTDFGGLAISCNNSETDCVIGGSVSQLVLLKKHLTDELQVRSKLLDVPMAFHTAAMDPILEEFTAFAAREVRVSPPTLPVVSNVLGRTVAVGEQAFSPEYFARQCRGTVAFDDGIQHFLALGGSDSTPYRWIEIGPHPSVQPMLRGRLDKAAPSHIQLTTLKKNVPPASSLSQLLSHFYQTSSGVNWRSVFSRNAHRRFKLVQLPGMPFFPSEFHVPYREMVGEPASSQPSGDAASNVVPNSFAVHAIQKLSHGVSNSCAIYETPAVLLKEFIEGHLVCGYALCPASVYHEMVLAALNDCQSAAGSSVVWGLSKVSYCAPMVYDANSNQVLRVVITPRLTLPDRYDFAVMSYLAGTDPNERSTVHCRGVVKQSNMASAELKYSRLQASMKGSVDSLKYVGQQGAPAPSCVQVFSKRAMYEKIFTRVVEYSDPYQKVETIRIKEETGEALATCVSPAQYLGRNSSIPASHAIFMDVLLHVAGFVSNLNLPNGVMGICKEVGGATTLRAPVVRDGACAPFDVYCSTFNTQDSDGRSFTISNAYAIDSDGVMAVFKGMVFQHVKMPLIEQALKRATRSSPNTSAPASHPAKPTRRNDVTSFVNAQSMERMALPRAAAPVRAAPEVSVPELVAKVCGLDAGQLGVDSRLDAHGVDSLMSIEIAAALSSALGVDVLPDTLGSCDTVGDIERLCEALSPTPVGNDVDNDSPTPGSERGSDSAISTPASVSTVDASIDMVRIVAELCGARAEAVSPDSELRALGVDSLMFLELADRLQDLDRGIALSSNDLADCQTIGDIERLIAQRPGAPGSQSGTSTQIPPEAVYARSEAVLLPAQQPATHINLLASEEAVLPQIKRLLHLSQQPEEIQVGSLERKFAGKSPLFLIHDGSGICTHYRGLRPLGRRVLALHDPKFLVQSSKQRSWASLTTMANEYASTISSTLGMTSGEDCILGGWSFGGVVAFEAARILMSRGHRVKGVVLIDSPPPIDHIPLSESIISAVTAQPAEKDAVAGSTTTASKCVSPVASAIRKLVQQSFRICAGLIGDFGTSAELQQRGLSKPAGPVPRVILLRSAVGWTSPRGYTGAAVGDMENPWLQNRRDRSLATAGWEVLTGGPIQCVDIPGNHFQVFDAPNIAAVSAALVDACSEFELK
ncbi:Beta-ketoacyl synthase [Beauveria brongniartii RCEF 3172]|uniref:Beta-ketoacyl synthase n=1 Tax=Beauveria brongniartii RCEF 3172 TaxID=1081107 RepID=A0A167KUX1_9HYPO|nr:Beta-ketoacyl synthase [Beauveria brongniartii RCEF 3172]